MALLREAYFELIKKLIIEELAEVMQLDNEPCWIDQRNNCPKNGMLLVDQKEACQSEIPSLPIPPA